MHLRFQFKNFVNFFCYLMFALYVNSTLYDTSYKINKLKYAWFSLLYVYLRIIETSY